MFSHKLRDVVARGVEVSQEAVVEPLPPEQQQRAPRLGKEAGAAPHRLPTASKSWRRLGGGGRRAPCLQGLRAGATSATSGDSDAQGCHFSDTSVAREASKQEPAMWREHRGRRPHPASSPPGCWVLRGAGRWGASGCWGVAGRCWGLRPCLLLSPHDAQEARTVLTGCGKPQTPPIISSRVSPPPTNVCLSLAAKGHRV